MREVYLGWKKYLREWRWEVHGNQKYQRRTKIGKINASEEMTLTREEEWEDMDLD